MIHANLTAHAETLRDENTGVTYEPASFDGGIGYVVTHPDGRQECLILHPSLWHDVNERGSQGDTFVYHMTAPQAKAWDDYWSDFAAPTDSNHPLSWADFTDNPITYVNHFENDPTTPKEDS